MGNNIKTDIRAIQEFAINKGGLLLSTEYINCKTNLLWQCENQHQWKSCWDNIKNSHQWCPYCCGNIKPDVKELQTYAINKNGKLVSTEYINALVKLVWECNICQHQWEANWNNIKDKNSWCPHCSSFKTEKLCREILERKLGIEFRKKRFWISNQRLEFDGYNEENKIAFEFHGEQHYEFPNNWHKTKRQFDLAQLRDDLKEQYCAENNIKLLIIPYTEYKNLEKYIDQLLQDVKL